MASDKNWAAYFLLAIAILASELLVCFAQDWRQKRQQLPIHDTAHRVSAIDVIPTTGVFNETMKNRVRRGQETVYKFSYKEYKNTITAVRIHVSAPRAREEYPILFDVRQQRFILSWQIPLMLENIYDYYNVSRTLCPIGQDQKHKLTEETQIIVEVSSASPEDVHFILRAEFVQHFQLSSMWRTVELTPSEPKYFMYTFPVDMDSVVVKVESNDQLCLVFSIQSTKCPVYDLIRDVEFSGKYQTVTKKGAIAVTRADYPSGQFFVVLVVTPNDFECLGVETLQPQPGKKSGLSIRNKKLQVKIEPSISGNQYSGAILVAVIFFAMFYGVAFCIILKESKSTSSGTEVSSDTKESGGTKKHCWCRLGPRVWSRYFRSAVCTVLRVPSLGGCPDKPSETGNSEPDMKYDLYYWNLIPISIFYALPVVQLVITYQTALHETGNEDICYYNFYCARSFGVFHSFNNIYSNIGYIMLGFLFLLLVHRQKMLYEENKKSFGLFYAMGIALIMQGVLSGCYHVCPSYSNFQFDTTYMYIIGWLCILKIFQSRNPTENIQAHVAYIAITFVIFLAVIGVMYGTLLFWIFFAIVYILVILFTSNKFFDKTENSKMTLLVIGNIVNISLALYGLITQPDDFATLLLSIFIINLLIYFAIYIIIKLFGKHGATPLPSKLLLSTLLLFSLIAWVLALYFFVAHLTSWQETPALSREGNKDCLFLDFYDDHDIWHMLSSVGLFFSFLILLELDYDKKN